jgi:GNAT superfamily N-acetyltransferase
MDGPIAIRDLRDDERASANALYRAIQFATTPPEAVALVAEIAGVRVGLGRLVTLAPEVLELGGIWTDDAMRGRGIARAMVTALLARLEGAGVERPMRPARRELWCIPFTHLSGFYQSFGFALRAPPWPPEIAAKVDDCVDHGLPPVVVLALTPGEAGLRAQPVR